MAVIETDAARATLDVIDSETEAPVDEALDAMAVQREFYGSHLEDVNREPRTPNGAQVYRRS